MAFIAAQTLSPVIGLFHDDAVYVATAKSLVDGEGYRLSNLPSEPFQTKYPPFYTALLALTWWLRPDFPENVIALKALNIVFVGLALFGVASLAWRQTTYATQGLPIACQAVLGTTPALIGLADFTMSDVLFTALVIWLLLLWSRQQSDETARREAGVVALCGLAILTRSLGIALTLAIVLECLLRRDVKRAVLHAVVGVAVMAAWMTWASAHRPDASPLISYYVEYERPAIVHLQSDPALVWSIIIGNARLILDSLPLTAGPMWLLLWPLLVPCMLAGGWRHLRTGRTLPYLFAAFYVGLILLHPFAPHRYLLPLLPILVLAALEGANNAWTFVRGNVAASKRPPLLPALLVAAIIVAGNLAWLKQRLRPAHDNLQGIYGIDLGYRWAGFEETFKWVQLNTAGDARIGSIFDPMYFLYSHRQAVRPWVHLPETYFYPYGRAKPYVGEPNQVAQQLADLGIDYIILDPPAGYAEGPAATSMLRVLLALPETKAELVFTSGDGQHLVYRLQRDVN